MKQIAVPRLDGFGDQVEAGGDPVDQPAEFRTGFDFRRGHAVATLHGGAIRLRLRRHVGGQGRRPGERLTVERAERRHRPAGVEHAIGQHRDAALAAQVRERIAHAGERRLGGFGAAGRQHHVGRHQSGADVGQRRGEKLRRERVRAILAEGGDHRAPGAAQPFKFERRQVGVAGAQIAERHAVMSGGILDRLIEIRERGRAEHAGRCRQRQEESQNRRSDRRAPHGPSPDCEYRGRSDMNRCVPQEYGMTRARTGQRRPCWIGEHF